MDDGRVISMDDETVAALRRRGHALTGMPFSGVVQLIVQDLEEPVAADSDPQADEAGSRDVLQGGGRAGVGIKEAEGNEAGDRDLQLAQRAEKPSVADSGDSHGTGRDRVSGRDCCEGDPPESKSMWSLLIGGDKYGKPAAQVGDRGGISSHRALLARKAAAPASGDAATTCGSLYECIASFARRPHRRISSRARGEGRKGKPQLGKLLAVSDPRKDGRPAGF